MSVGWPSTSRESRIRSLTWVYGREIMNLIILAWYVRQARTFTFAVAYALVMKRKLPRRFASFLLISSWLLPSTSPNLPRSVRQIREKYDSAVSGLISAMSSVQRERVETKRSVHKWQHNIVRIRVSLLTLQKFTCHPYAQRLSNDQFSTYTCHRKWM